MKKALTLTFSFCFLFIQILHIQGEKLPLIEFKIARVKDSTQIQEKKEKRIFNAAYSSVLPPNCIYRIQSKQNEREAIIQIVYNLSSVPEDTIYLSEEMYDFLIHNTSESEENRKIKLTFLGWGNKETTETDFLNLQSLIITPEASRSKIVQNGLDKYYIQLGAFRFYQNSYLKIMKLLPYLELRPNFYMVKTGGTQNETLDSYRVLAGPYSYEDAFKITEAINHVSEEPVLLRDSKTILKEGKKK